MWLETLSFSSDSSFWDWDNLNNTGHANNLRRLIPSVSALTKILLLGSLKPNPFSKLKNLKKLWLSGFGLSKPSDLDELTALSELTSLQMLAVSRTRVTDLTPLAGLISLNWLDVSRTRVTDLRPISGLVSLQTLDLLVA